MLDQPKTEQNLFQQPIDKSVFHCICTQFVCFFFRKFLATTAAIFSGWISSPPKNEILVTPLKLKKKECQHKRQTNQFTNCFSTKWASVLILSDNEWWCVGSHKTHKHSTDIQNELWLTPSSSNKLTGTK